MDEPPQIDRLEILRRIRELETKIGKKQNRPKPIPKASPELWPGESIDLGGFTIAELRRRIRERMG